MSAHRWSGWPGAYCLDCGAEDPYEIAEADGKIDYVDDLSVPEGIRPVIAPEVQAEIDKAMICPEPGSNRCNPYTERSGQ